MAGPRRIALMFANIITQAEVEIQDDKIRVMIVGQPMSSSNAFTISTGEGAQLTDEQRLLIGKLVWATTVRELFSKLQDPEGTQYVGIQPRDKESDPESGSGWN